MGASGGRLRRAAGALLLAAALASCGGSDPDDAPASPTAPPSATVSPTAMATAVAASPTATPVPAPADPIALEDAYALLRARPVRGGGGRLRRRGRDGGRRGPALGGAHGGIGGGARGGRPRTRAGAGAAGAGGGPRRIARANARRLPAGPAPAERGGPPRGGGGRAPSPRRARRRPCAGPARGRRVRARAGPEAATRLARRGRGTRCWPCPTCPSRCASPSCASAPRWPAKRAIGRRCAAGWASWPRARARRRCATSWRRRPSGWATSPSSRSSCEPSWRNGREADEALQAIADLRDAGFTVDAGAEGYVLYRRRAYAEARAVLAAGLTDPELTEAERALPHVLPGRRLRRRGLRGGVRAPLRRGGGEPRRGRLRPPRALLGGAGAGERGRARRGGAPSRGCGG